METLKKIYTKDNVEVCRDFVFGYTRFFKNYDITSDNYDIYLIGKNQIKKKNLFMELNKSDFLKECKKIGRSLCDILLNNLNNHFEIISMQHEDIINIQPYLINLEDIMNNKNEIIKLIKGFILKYGIPVNYELVTSLYCETNNTNTIGLRELCTYFMLINIISDLAFYDKKGIKIETYYNLFHFNKTEDNEEIISKLFNIELLHSHHIGDYYIKYVNNFPVCYTPNLFTFAFEQLKYNIIKRKNNISIITEIAGKKKKIPKSKKELSRNTSATYFTMQKIDYNRLIKCRNIIKKYDINNKYQNLILELDKVKKIKDIKRTIHTPLIEEAYHVAYNLKNEKK